jgi:hypothetical protein
VQADIERLLRERRNITGEEDDFTVRDMKQIAETQTATTGSSPSCSAPSPASACWSAASAS